MYKKQNCPGSSEINLDQSEDPKSWRGKDTMVGMLADLNGAISRKYSQTPSYIYVCETGAAASMTSEQARAHYQYHKRCQDSKPFRADLPSSRKNAESSQKQKWIRLKEDPVLYQPEAPPTEEPTKEERERQRLMRLQDKIRNEALQASL